MTPAADGPPTDIHAAIAAIEAADAYSSLPSAAYLVHAFSHEKAGVSQGLEIGYYDPDSRRITSFTLAPVCARCADEVFTQKESLDALDIDAVTIGLAQARSLSQAHVREHFPHHSVMQSVLVLQQERDPVWKITAILHTFQMVHLVIHAGTGEVVSSELKHLFDLGTRLPGTGE